MLLFWTNLLFSLKNKRKLDNEDKTQIEKSIVHHSSPSTWFCLLLTAGSDWWRCLVLFQLSTVERLEHETLLHHLKEKKSQQQNWMTGPWYWVGWKATSQDFIGLIMLLYYNQKTPKRSCHICFNQEFKWLEKPSFKYEKKLKSYFIYIGVKEPPSWMQPFALWFAFKAACFDCLSGK